ncbi:MAG: contractile injection system tape measure protein [Methylococcales bacterium]|nr:contractile injection system tape measure protein [Methylococcales bacterium]
MNNTLLRLLPNNDSSQEMPSHSVARCFWDTALDEQSMSHRLQEHLSHWSKTELNSLLEQAFELYCPVGHIWRIDTLELNLGEIAFDELQTELPKRLKNCLHEELRRLLQNTSWQTDPAIPNGFQSEWQNDTQILSQTGSFNDFIDYFLRHGTIPWWYNSKEGHTQILLQQLQDAPEQVADIIRRTGKAEAVRRRIAWQYLPAVIQKIIAALEPSHHEYIVAFADNLQDLQVKNQKLKSDRKVFERQSWFWILTHLLVERGSLFNTMAFVESTLMQMANSYQLDYHFLLQQLVAAAQSLEFKGSNPSPSFIQALLGVQQKGLSKSVPDLALMSNSDEAIELYSLNDFIDYFLRHGTIPWWYNSKEGHTQILLQQLQDASEQVANIIRRAGKTEAVRKRIAWQYQPTLIRKIIAVLEPSHHEYIVVFADNLQNLQAKTQQPKSDSVLFEHQSWFWILTHLLVERGSLFNAIAFVESTLMQMANSYQLDYHILLQQLVTVAQSVDVKGDKPQFIQALLDVQQKVLSKNEAIEIINSNNLEYDVYYQALTIYLSTGQVPKVIGKHYLPAVELMFSTLLYYQPQRLVSTLSSVKIRADVNRFALTKRLLVLIQSADFSRVLNILNTQAASFATNLIAWILRWQSQHKLPSLSGFDVYYELHSVVLGMLIDGFESDFTVAKFMRVFLEKLNKCGINSQTLVAEITLCLSADNIQNSQAESEQQAMFQWLRRAKTKSFSTTKNNVMQLGEDGAITQKIATLLAILRGETLGLKQLGLVKSNLKSTLSSLFTAVEFPHTNLLLEQLQQQADRKVLALALLEQNEVPEIQQWLDSLWSTDGRPALSFLTEWQNAIAHSGLWQGSTKVLQQKLHDIFWLSLLDRAFTTRRTLSQADIDSLLSEIVQLSCAELHIKPVQLGQNKISDHAPLWNTALLHLAQTENKTNTANQPISLTTGLSFEQDSQRRYLNHPLFSKLCEYLLLHGRTPLWIQTSIPLDLQQMLADLLHDNPKGLNEILKRIEHDSRALFRLYHLLDFKDLQIAVSQTNPELKPLLSILVAVYQNLSKLHFSGVDANLLPTIIWQKTLHAWLNGDWQNLSAQHIFFELSTELMRRHALTSENIATEFKRNVQHFPKECRIMRKDEQIWANQVPTTSKNNIKPPITPNKDLTARPTEQTMPIQISNAGLVILQGFIGTYFNRLGLIDNSEFCSTQAQRNAVHCLQYLASGLAATEEQHLVLNKLLCGLLVSDPIELGFDLTPKDKTIADSLIEAVINYWSAIGSSSIDGFRGNWLIRNGLLRQNEGRWDLVVEKRPYDLLLQSSPFSFQLIKLPWMTTPLYVTWPT